MAMYNPVTDSFTYYTPVETPKPIIEFPLSKEPLDISDWASGITSDGNIIASPNTPETKTNYQDIMNRMAETHSEQTINDNTQVQEKSSKRITKEEQKNNAIHIMNSLINKGLKPHQAAGVVGNLMVESQLNPGAYNPNDIGLPGGGLAGFRGPLFSRLKSYTSNKGKSWKDLDSQIDFLYDILNENNSQMNDVRNRLLNATNPHEASEAWAYYEKYAGYDGTTKTAKKAGWSQERINQEHKNRSNYAREIYELWKSRKS